MAKSPHQPKSPEPEPLAGLSARIPESIVGRLQDAAHQRKRVKSPPPRTQAEIVAAALTEWLDRHGH